MQAPEPVLLLYVPALHREHTPPFGPVYPALQMHDTLLLLLIGEFVLLGHAKHAVAAVVVEYVPAGQDIQVIMLIWSWYCPGPQGTHPK